MASVSTARIELFGWWNDEPEPSPHWVERPDGRKVLHLWPEAGANSYANDDKLIASTVARPGVGRNRQVSGAPGGSAMVRTGRWGMRAGLYARYSVSDNQRDATIEDQLRLCREHAQRQGWLVVDSYSDRAISGASLVRPGVQKLIADAGRGRFDVILTESLDRLSRDLEDAAGLFKKMAFAGIKIWTVGEGEIRDELLVGVRGRDVRALPARPRG